jgi:hypothetical protein
MPQDGAGIRYCGEPIPLYSHCNLLVV